MGKIRVAIIGLGHLGSKHLKVYHELKDRVNITGISDVKQDRLQILAKEYNIPFFSNYQDLKDHADAVNICAPTSLHHKIGQFFLKHKIHTFIEKPIAMNLKQADRLIALADRHNLKLQVGHVERFNCAFEAVKPLVYNPYLLNVIA